MGTPDEWQERQTGLLRKRHEDQIRILAERLQEQSRLIITRLDKGNVLSMHGSLVVDAVELDRRGAALEAIREVSEINATTDEG